MSAPTPPPSGAPASPTVVILRTGRAEALGESLRTATWRRLMEGCGADVHELRLFHDQRIRTTLRNPPRIDYILRGRGVAESMAWSDRSLSDALQEINPTLTIALTSRCFSPALLERRLVLDFVDRLSDNYRTRGRSAGWTPRGIVLRSLAPLHDRFERWAAEHVAVSVAAGWRDSQLLNATWLPILAPEMDVAPPQPTADLLFFGNLSYEPNVAAVRTLGGMWAEIQRRHPGATMRIAGRYPSQEVTDLVTEHGWDLQVDFTDVSTLCASAAIGVSPIPFATGIQCKVLETAAAGTAQVISAQAAAGFGPHVPAVVGASPEEFVDRVVELLASEAERRAAVRAAHDVIDTHYSVRPWLPLARKLLDDG